MPNKHLLVCDLDNTLYDWVGYFVPAFYAMVDAVVEITQCEREKLLDDFRAVHQKQRDSEQPFALLETDTIKIHFKGASPELIMAALDPAFHSFNSARKKYLRLHEGVRETLSLLRANGVKLVAHTESKLYGVVDRLNRLELFHFFSKIYCRERSMSLDPRNQKADWLSQFPMEKVVELSHHQMKPNPTVLLEICNREGFEPESTAYIGDSIARDILMAKDAGVFAIWAAYGAQHDAALYDKLVRVSHWTPEDVKREKELKIQAEAVQPDFTAKRSFVEVLSALGIQATLQTLAC